MLSPPSVINDGKFEIYFADEPMDTVPLIQIFEQAKKGGEHFYDTNGTCYKVNKLRLENKSVKTGGDANGSMNSKQEYATQDINIDGEDLQFDKYVKMECMHHSIELIVDFEQLFRKYYPVKDAKL